MKSPTIPRWILGIILPDTMRGAVLGDLEEGYAQAASPRTWYWMQALRSIGPALRLHWRALGAIRIVAAAIACYVVGYGIAFGIMELASRVAQAPIAPAVFRVFSLLAGAIGATAGGAVMRLMASRRALQIFCGVLAVAGVPSAAFGFGVVPLWYIIVAPAIPPLAAWCGGILAGGEKAATSSPSTPTRTV